MAEFNNLYQRAIYYDIVFKRDVTSEIDFLCEVYDRLNGHAPSSLLDLACGPAYHARNFAKRRLRAVALDLREEMLKFAADQAATEGITGIEWIAADMRYLNLQQPVDIALNAFDGIDCLLTNDDLVDHCQAIASCLTTGGLYVIDVTHPRLTDYNFYEPWRYSGERDGVQVEIAWATNAPRFDALTNTTQTDVEIRVNDNGETMIFRDTAEERVVDGPEIDLLARLSGFKVRGWYGSYNINDPIKPMSGQMIAVLQKQG